MFRMNTSVHRLFGCGLLMLLLSGCYNITFETVPGTHPVKDMRLTLHDRRVAEIFIRVHSGVRLDSLVDISYFDGLDHRMSLDVAKQRFGQPQGVRTQPDMRRPVHLYSIPKGEVGFMAVPSSGGTQHQVWAFPTNQSPASVIRDASLREQLLPRLSGGPVRIHVLREVGFGGVTLSMTSNRVDYLILGPRDGE
jgi:hypothetical protein